MGAQTAFSLSTPGRRRGSAFLIRQGARGVVYGAQVTAKAGFATAKLGGRRAVKSRGLFFRGGTKLASKVIFPLAIADAVLAGVRAGGSAENRAVVAQAQFIGVKPSTVRRLGKASREGAMFKGDIDEQIRPSGSMLAHSPRVGGI